MADMFRKKKFRNNSFRKMSAEERLYINRDIAIFHIKINTLSAAYVNMNILIDASKSARKKLIVMQVMHQR